MTRKGYLNQQLEQLRLVMARLVGVRGTGVSVRPELYAEAKSLTGINLALLPTLSDATLLSLFKGGTVLDAARCVVAAHLIAEDAALFAGEGKNAEARAGFRRAVLLLDAALTHEEALRTPEYHQKRQEWAAQFAALPSANPITAPT